MLEEISYLTSPTGIIGFNRKKTSPSEDNIYYTLKDYLGSIMVVASATGTKLEEYSYDAWGRRRNHTNWQYSGATAPSYIMRGYTGHEHIEEVGLINMNGRVYDPLVGLFLSPDPIVQAPQNALNYNRYSYAFNNPLKYTDPSGYMMELLRLDIEAGERGNTGGGDRVLSNMFNEYYSHTNFFDSSPYSFDWGSGTYRNSSGDIISFQDVYSTYILPSALVTKRGSEAQNLLSIFQEANFNVSFETAGNTVGFVAYDGVLPSGVIDAWKISGKGSGLSSSGRNSDAVALTFAGLTLLSEYGKKTANAIKATQSSTAINTGKLYWIDQDQLLTSTFNPRLTKVATTAKWAGRGFVAAGVVVSTIDGVNAYNNGDINGVKMAGFDIIAGLGTAAIGGPIGLILYGGYILTMHSGPNPAPPAYITNPMSPWNTMPRVDNTYVAPNY